MRPLALAGLALAGLAAACTPSPPPPPPPPATSPLTRLPKGTRLAKPEGHLAGVRCLAFSPDGRQLVSGSDDSTLLVWDAETGALVQRLEGHQGWVKACLFLPDGRLASGGVRGEVFVWDLARGQVVERLTGLGSADGAVYALGVRPDGRELMAGTYYGRVVAWRLDTGGGASEVGDLGGKPGESKVWAVGYLGENRRWAAGDNGTRVWGGPKPADLGVDAASGLVLPGGRLALGAEGQVIVILPDGGRRRLPGRHSAWGYGLAANTAGELLVAGDFAGHVEVWALAGETLRCRLNAAAGITAAAFDPRGTRFVVAGNEGELEVVPLDACENGQTIEPSKTQRWGLTRGRVWSVAAGASVLLGDSRGQVSAWQPTSWRLERARKVHAGEVLSLVVLPGNRWVSGGADTKVFLGEPGELKALGSPRRMILALASTRDGGAVLAADDSGALTELPAEGGLASGPLVQAQNVLYALAVSPDGSHALAGGAVDVVYRVPLAGGALDKWPYELSPGEGTYTLKFLSGERWAQGGTSGTVLVRRGPSVETYLRGLSRQVSALASVEPHLWAGGDDQRLVRWSVNGALDPDRVLDEGAKILGLAVTPDARFLVAGLGDGRATVRALPEGELVAQLVPLRDGGGVTILADGSVAMWGEDAKRLRFEDSDPTKRRVFTLGGPLAPSVRSPVLTRLGDGAVQVRTTVLSPEGPPRLQLDGRATLRSVYPSPTVLEAYDVEFELYDPQGGQHRLEVMTPAAERPLESTFALAPDPKLGPGKARALLVGNADYDTLPDLPGVNEDLKAMRKFLTGPGGWGLVQGRISVPPPNLNAKGLREAARQFFAEAEEGETLLFYYSGHGDRRGDEGYLVATDGVPGQPEGALSASDLWAMIASSKAAKVLVILDACKSGGFALPNAVEKAAVSSKAAFLTATEVDTAASSSSRGSTFTRALLEALRNPRKIDPSVLAVTTQSAYHAAAEQVPKQYAALRGAKAVFDLPLGWPALERERTGGATSKGAGSLLREVDAASIVKKQVGVRAGLGSDRSIEISALFDGETRALQVGVHQPAGDHRAAPRPFRVFEAPNSQPWRAGQRQSFTLESPQLPKGKVRLEIRGCKASGDCAKEPARTLELDL